MLTLAAYFRWHYGDGLRSVIHNASLRVLGFFRYFSVAVLSRTLFYPWHRIRESYGRGFILTDFLTHLIVNMFSRLVGSAVRLIVISTGLIMGLFAVLFGIAGILLWLILPIVIPLLLLFGILILNF